MTRRIKVKLLTFRRIISYSEFMEPQEQDTLKALIGELTRLIHAVLNRNKALRSTIRQIEGKGYHVDIVLASMTRLQKKEAGEQRDAAEHETTEFDKEFLKSIRIRLDQPSDR